MKITFVLPVVSMSGGIKVVTIYAKLLAELGHEVILVSPAPQKLSIAYKLKSLIKGLGWPQKKEPKSYFYNSGLNHYVLGESRPINNQDLPDADAVIATWWETAEWVNALSHSKGTKIYFVQGHEVFDFLPKVRSESTYRLPLHKITVSKFLVDIMKNQYGDCNVDLVPNSIDEKQFYAPTRDKQVVPTIGFLFARSALKGVDVCLNVINELRYTFPNIRVISFGSTIPADFFDWDERIEFYHSPAQSEIRTLYSQCDFWLSASRSEGFNLTAMEAMACRTPVVCTKTGWPIESIVSGYNGYLVNIDDVNAMVSAAKTILTLSNHEWKKYSLNAFKTVENSSWKNSAKLFEQAITKAVNSNIKNN